MRLHAWVAPFFLLACACSAALSQAEATDQGTQLPDALPPPPPPPPPTESPDIEISLLTLEQGGLPVLDTDGKDKVVRELHNPITKPKDERDISEDKPKGVAASSVQSAGGALDQSRVQSAVAASMDAFRQCLSADAVVTLEALVSPRGEVLESNGVTSMPNDLRMRDCVSRAFRKVSLGETGSHDPTLFRLSLSLRMRR